MIGRTMKKKIQRIQILKIRIVDVRTDGQLNLVESSYGAEAPRGYKSCPYSYCNLNYPPPPNTRGVAFLKLQKNQKMTPQKDYKNLDLPMLGLKTITGRSPHEFSEFWRSHPVRGVVVCVSSFLVLCAQNLYRAGRFLVGFAPHTFKHPSIHPTQLFDPVSTSWLFWRYASGCSLVTYSIALSHCRPHLHRYHFIYTGIPERWSDPIWNRL